MFKQNIVAGRWFVWTLVFLVGIGLGLVSYLQWVNIELGTDNVVAASELGNLR